MRLRGGGYDREEEERCRSNAQILHQNTAMTSVAIAEAVNLQHGTDKDEVWVRRWWNRRSAGTRPGQGRKPKFESPQKEKVVRMCSGYKRYRDGTCARNMSIREAAHEYNRTHDTQVSKTTVALWLKESGKVYRHLSVVSLLTELHVSARERLYKRIVEEKEYVCADVVFTDSTIFPLIEKYNQRNQGFWLEKGERSPTGKKVKHPTYFHVYGGLSRLGVVGPYFIPAGVGINAHRYRVMVLAPMIRDLEKLFGEEEFIFQQDGAPAHFAESTLEYLDGKGVNYWEKGYWPGSSPDLSPIENFWSIMKARVYKNGKVQNIRSGHHRVTRFFNTYPVDEARKLQASFLTRVLTLPAHNFRSVQ